MSGETDDGPSLLELQLYRIRCLARAIKMGDPLDQEDREWLSGALKAIGDGGDPIDALSIRGQRGKDRKKANSQKTMNAAYAVSMVYMLTQPPDAPNPDERGDGQSFDDALDMAAETTGLDRDTIRDYWNKNPDMRRPGFNPPLSSRPLWPKGK